MTPTNERPRFPHLSLAARKAKGYYRITVHVNGRLKRVIPADSEAEAKYVAKELRAANKGTKGLKVTVHHQPGAGDIAYDHGSNK